MRKVLICDDEFLVRAGLETIIPWSENGMDVVGLAKNGKEAVELYDKHLPDVVITDIKMPIIDGLELLKILKGKRKDLITIILSHYDDFSYVKEALNNGATDYILKSQLSPASLIEVLQKYLSELQPIVPDSQPGAADDAHLLQKALCYICQGGRWQGADDQPGMLITMLKQQLIERQYLFLVMTILFSDRQAEKTDTILRSLESVLRNKLPKYALRIYFPASNTGCILLDADLQSGPLGPLSVAKSIQATLLQFLNLAVRIGVSDISFEPTDIQERFDEAVRRNQYAFFEQKSIAVDDHSKPPTPEPTQLPGYNALRTLLENADETAMRAALSSHYNQLYLHGDLQLVQRFYGDLCAAMKYLTVKRRKNAKAQARDVVTMDMRPFESFASFDELKQYVEQCCALFLRDRDEQLPRTLSPITRSCLQFIHDNYYRNISLADAADYTETSKSYLSTLFKQEKGTRFSVYLNGYRLEKAKELLVSSNYLIYEVAEMVGFDNPYYFSKLFKETFGVSCKEYRKETLAEPAIVQVSQGEEG